MKTYTSKVGSFEFPDDVSQAHAKQVRDAVVGQILSPEPGTKRPKTATEVVEWVRESCSEVIRHTVFTFYPAT